MVVKLLCGSHQADVALLNEVKKVKTPMDVLLGHRDNQPEIGFNESSARRFQFSVTVTGRLEPSAQPVLAELRHTLERLLAETR